MGWFSKAKKQVPIYEVAKDVSNAVTSAISATAETLKEFSSAVNEKTLTLETAYLLMTAAHEAMVHAVDSRRTLATLGQNFLERMQSSFAEPLNYEPEAFGKGFIPRLDEYCGILHSDLAPESKIQQIGFSFSKHLNTSDAAIVFCASMSFSQYKVLLYNFVSDASSRFELV
jgi:hypothetical protein